MKVTSRALMVVLTLLSVTAAAPGMIVQKPRPRPAARTVRDYFLLVPDKYVGYQLEFRQYILKGGLVVVVDVSNGYISYDESDNPEQFEFAIFRKSNGRYLVAFSVGYNSQFPDATSKLLLLSYEGGKWRDVTRAMLPVAFDKRKTYKLPRRGRNIDVTDEWGHKFYTLTWRNDRFIINRAAGK